MGFPLPRGGRVGPRALLPTFLALLLALALLAACGGATSRTGPAARPTATTIPTVAATKGDGRPPLALGADVTRCSAVPGFQGAGAASAGAGFADVPFPPDSLGLGGAASDNLYHFQVVDVCTGGLGAPGVLAFFAARMVAGGWARSDTYPYGGDPAHACGDPYCWRTPGKTPKDTPRYVSIERMGGGAAIAAYTLRLATAPAPRAQLAIRSASGAARNGYISLTVSTGCAAGEQMLGGGYYLSSSDHTYGVQSSYPSGPSTWTVTGGGAGGASPFELQAYVGCLQANYSLGTKLVSAPINVASGGSQAATAACPAGGVVTGGGLQIVSGPGVAAGSAPTPQLDGWTAKAAAGMGAVRATAYALCAARNLAAGAAIARGLTLYSDNDAQLSLGCDGGQWLTEGGFSNNDPTGDGKNVYSLDGPTADYSRWFLQGHNLDAGATHGAVMWVVCLAPAPRF